MSKILTPKSFKANIDRALHNLYHEAGTTMHPMLHIPLFYRRMMRGDKFDFGVLESVLRSEPTFAPLFSNWQLRFEWYFDSDANRYGWIDNNSRLTSEEVMNRKHHTAVFQSRANIDDDALSYDSLPRVGRGSVCDYSGVAPGYTYLHESDYDSDSTQYGARYNVDFHLTYLNIIRNYHVNKQFPDIPYITNGGTTIASALLFKTYSLRDMDNLFVFLRSCPNGVNFNVLGDDVLPSGIPEELGSYYGDAIEAFQDYLISCEKFCGGLFCAEFQPDLYQNLLSKDQGLLRSQVNIETVNGQQVVSIDTFRLGNHLQALYDKIFVSGGTDRDLSRTIWGIESNRDYDIPELLCTHSEIIGTNLVTSTTAGEVDYEQPLGSTKIKNVPGSMAGNINERRGRGRMQKFTAKTSGSLMCLVSLVPLVSYSENIERHLLEHNFMDEFTPDMARKGFEDVPLSDYCVLPVPAAGSTGIDINATLSLDTSVGKQVAWLREMTAVNRVYGEFSNGGEKADWFLTRRYIQAKASGALGKEISISPYGNPLQFQYPFVSQSLLDPNFSLQVAFYCKAYRPVPRRFMPNLGY